MDMFAILLDDLLSSFDKLRNSRFEKTLVFRSEDWCNSFLTSWSKAKVLSFKWFEVSETNDNLMVLGQSYKVYVASVPIWALWIIYGLSKKCGVLRYHDRTPRVCDRPVQSVFPSVQFRLLMKLDKMNDETKLF